MFHQQTLNCGHSKTSIRKCPVKTMQPHPGKTIYDDCITPWIKRHVSTRTLDLLFTIHCNGKAVPMWLVLLAPSIVLLWLPACPVTTIYVVFDFNASQEKRSTGMWAIDGWIPSMVAVTVRSFPVFRRWCRNRRQETAILPETVSFFKVYARSTLKFPQYKSEEDSGSGSKCWLANRLKTTQDFFLYKAGTVGVLPWHHASLGKSS